MEKIPNLLFSRHITKTFKTISQAIDNLTAIAASVNIEFKAILFNYAISLTGASTLDMFSLGNT